MIGFFEKQTFFRNKKAATLKYIEDLGGVTHRIDTSLLIEHLDFLLSEARVVRARRVPASIRNKRKRYYRKNKSKIKRRQRRYRRKPKTKRMAKRRAVIKKRLHIRPGSRRRIKL